MRIRLAALALLASGACAPAPPTVSGGGAGLVSVAWVGQDSGRFSAPARGSWCPGDTMVQISAIRSDTAFGFALFVEDTVRPAQHPVLSSEVTADWRPLATAALRWFAMSPAGAAAGTSTDVKGWEATSGVVSVQSVDSGPSGTVDLRLRLVGGFDTLRLTGTFASIPIEPAVGACGRVVRPPPRREGR